MIDEVDWSATPLGPRDSWPAALRYAVSLCLASGLPMLIWWGPDAIQIYNDAYVELLGKRHPTAFGQSGSECWPEVWDAVGPIVANTRETGASFSGEDMQFMLERNGFAEEAYFTFSYSRIDGDGAESGVLCANTETTKNVLRERDFRAMADTIANVVFTQAPDGALEWANTRWYDYSRLPREIAITPAGWKRVMAIEDYDGFVELLAHALAVGDPYEIEIRIKPDGGDADSYRWFLIRAIPMRASDGSIIRYAGSATDINDSRVAAEALRTQLELEHRASTAFQEAALPEKLPSIPGLTFGAVYEPAGTEALVGGDWFDAFRLPDGRVVLSVGDVMGSGLPAAVTMAAVRQAIRGAAHVHADPAIVLDAADLALRSEQPDRIVTAFVGVLDPLTLTLSFASAGHPPPFVRQPDGTVVELRAFDLPLGLRDERNRDPSRNASIVLKDRSLLVLYTDGLTEATRDALEGERLLQEALAMPEVYKAPDPAALLRTKLPAAGNDDVAILTVRIEADEDLYRETRWEFAADDVTTAMNTRRAIGAILERFGSTSAEASDAELIFGELLGNVVRHTDGTVEAALDLTGDAPVIHVLDRGPGFTFHARLPNDRMSETGRGLYIATMLASDVTVTCRADGGSHARAVLSCRLPAEFRHKTLQTNERA